VGASKLSGGRKFAEELFDTKSSLFEPIELTDPTGRRFLIRKLQDVEPRVPPLDEIRAEVVLSWKSEQARAPAEEAANAFAAKAKGEGGKIVGEIVDGRPVIVTDPVTRLRPGAPLPGQFFETGPPTPSPIPQMPASGNALREAYFSLQSGDAVVAANEPKTVYYVMTLNQRFPATFSALYAPNGDYFRYLQETLSEAAFARSDDWLKTLRAQAGLPSGWTLNDESRKGADLDRG
jgi:peptidyl-prolyl cis-trans isomerase D